MRDIKTFLRGYLKSKIDLVTLTVHLNKEEIEIAKDMEWILPSKDPEVFYINTRALS
jgi:hypothetical protein